MNEGMSKKDWINQFKKEIQHYTDMKKEYSSFLTKAKNYEVKGDLERMISYTNERIKDCQRRINDMK